MTTPFAVSFSAIVESIFGVFLVLQWQLPVLPIGCMVLGYFIARKTHRSVFNWILVGLINGIIPVLGPILMVIAYFFYPPPAPTVRPGYNPPGSSRPDPRKDLPKRPRDRSRP